MYWNCYVTASQRARRNLPPGGNIRRTSYPHYVPAGDHCNSRSTIYNLSAGGTQDRGNAHTGVPPQLDCILYFKEKCYKSVFKKQYFILHFIKIWSFKQRCQNSVRKIFYITFHIDIVIPYCSTVGGLAFLSNTKIQKYIKQHNMCSNHIGTTFHVKLLCYVFIEVFLLLIYVYIYARDLLTFSNKNL